MSWMDVPIKDVCELVADCVNKTAPIVEYETPYKMLRTSNVRGGFVDTKNTRFVTEETFIKWTRRGIPKKGDVILTREAPLGDVGRLTSDDAVFLGQRLFMYRADPRKLNLEYLAYVLQSPLVQGRIKSKGFGATVEHARVGDCENLLIPLPDLATQEKIGKILSTYDDLIENNKRRIALLEESARQLYKEWFVRFRYPGHEHVKIVDGVPEGWEKIDIGNLASFLSRGMTPKYDDEGEFIVINQKCIRNRLLSFNLVRRQDKEVDEKKLIRYGDVLINSTGTGTLGRVAQCWTNPNKCTVDTHVTIVRPKDNVDKLWFGYSLMELECRFEDMGEGATNQKELKKSLVSALSVVLPPKIITKQFEDIITNITNQIVVLSDQNNNLTRARDLLLPKLMNGEIAV